MFFYQIEKNVAQLQSKWSNIKPLARRRQKIIIDATKKTGGGSLTEKQKGIIDGPLYRDIATRLGISASGNVPRFDSDSADQSEIEPPSKRLKSKLSLNTSGDETIRRMQKTFSNVHSRNTTLIHDCVPRANTNVVTQVTHSDQLTERSHAQIKNDLNEKLLLSRLETAGIVKEKEKIDNELVEIELMKAPALMDDEIDHKRTMMKLEEETGRLNVERAKQS